MEVSDYHNCSKAHMAVLAARPELPFQVVDGNSAVGSASPGSCPYCNLDVRQWESDDQVRQTHSASAGGGTATADSDRV